MKECSIAFFLKKKKERGKKTQLKMTLKMRALFIFAMWKVKIVYDNIYGLFKTVYKVE